MSMSIPRVAVYGKRSTQTKSIQKAVRELGGMAEILRPGEINFLIDSGSISALDRKLDYDAVLNWNGNSAFRREEILLLGNVLGLTDNQENIINGPFGPYKSNNKLISTIILSKNGIPVPTSVFSVFDTEADGVRERFPGNVHKPTLEGGGIGVSKLADDDEPRLFAGIDPGILQEEITTPGDEKSDYRAFVVDGSVVVSVERVGGDEFITNLTKGSEGRKATLPDKATSLAIEAADSLGLDVCGVDLIQDENDNWYVIEVNAPAGFSHTQRVSGVNPSAYIAGHLLEVAGHEVDEEHVETLAKELEFEKPKTTVWKTVNLTDQSVIVVHGNRQSIKVNCVVDKSRDIPVLSRETAFEAGCVVERRGKSKKYPLNNLGEDEKRDFAKVRFQLGNSVFTSRFEIVPSDSIEHDLILTSYQFSIGHVPSGTKEGPEKRGETLLSDSPGSSVTSDT